MLLAPDTTYQQIRFPAAWQLSSQERQALQDQLPRLTEALRRVSHSHLGTDITIGTPRLLWQQSELEETHKVTGPTLVSRFGDSHQMVTRIPQAIAASCVGPLLGYPTKLELSSEELTWTDLAILQPYLEALAGSVLSTLFGSRGRHQILPANTPQSQLASESFAVAVPLGASGSRHDIVMAAPTAAWRNRLAANSETDPTRLQLLPNNRKMIVQLQAAGQPVAAGQAGAQGSQLSVRLLAANTYSGSHTVMNEYSNTAPESEQQLSAAQTSEATDLDSPDGIPVAIQIRLGRVVMPLGELQELRAGTVVPLDHSLDDPVEILAGNKLVARGEIVAVEDQLGVRILQVAEPNQAQTEAVQ